MIRSRLGLRPGRGAGAQPRRARAGDDDAGLDRAGGSVMVEPF